VIPIGGLNGVIPFDLENTNLKVTNSVKLLGLDLDGGLGCLGTVHEKTHDKIWDILTFWSRFWLSLPGRINIVKTLCLSQLNYLACIITPTDLQLEKIESLMNKFVKGSLNISKEKMYKTTAEGGLGLFDLKSYICAQQTQWVKRVLFAACDTWQEEIYNITYGNPLLLNPVIVNRAHNPIIYNIAVSFEVFKTKYWSLNDNFKKAPILFNPLLTRGRGDKRLLDHNFFNQNPPVQLDRLAKCKFNYVFSNTPLMLETINHNLNLGLNLVTYMRLTSAASNHFRTVKRVGENNGTSLDLTDFFASFKKGSRVLRNILVKTQPFDIKSHKSFKTFCNITNAWVSQLSTNQNNLWSYNHLKNDFREFIFKFYNNLLGLNTRVSHFVLNVDRNCTICRAGHVERYQLQSYRFKPFFVTL
jgi:hypothetical protein